MSGREVTSQAICEGMQLLGSGMYEQECGFINLGKFTSTGGGRYEGEMKRSPVLEILRIVTSSQISFSDAILNLILR
ncbi:predicted protein [Sclerotinia sclerotiorum 1980 UF-70]|uniref:Uncharacterized protein n=1 Tax=Sclerotinia sclerotiorum (strain ATCC 18683 / 1980 / Ss-1) TaxID=665079 RepID=A7F5H1_SCLS1|nr:predicted protein [Sclerotinia sclerotiorum 1980 UF-70]EDN97992.1 predicted protein [Sclerotinia sclerotiorum 1980 UF-70]